MGFFRQFDEFDPLRCRKLRDCAILSNAARNVDFHVKLTRIFVGQRPAPEEIPIAWIHRGLLMYRWVCPR